MTASRRDPNSGRFVRVYQPWTPDRWDEACKITKGYMRVYRPDHPRTVDGYALRAHVVWFIKPRDLVRL